MKRISESGPTLDYAEERSGSERASWERARAHTPGPEYKMISGYPAFCDPLLMNRRL